MSIPTAQQIRDILRRYSVRNHYLSPGDRDFHEPRMGKRVRYAVWADGNRASEPSSHLDAQKAREDLIIRDLRKLVGG